MADLHVAARGGRVWGFLFPYWRLGAKALGVDVSTEMAMMEFEDRAQRWSWLASVSCLRHLGYCIEHDG